MERRSQGSFEYLLMLAAVLLLVGAIISLIGLTAQGLGSNVGGQIDNIRDNLVIPSLVGTAVIIGSKRW